MGNRVVISAVLLLMALTHLPRAGAASLSGAGLPDVSFTVLAEQFLREQLGLASTNLPVSPTNSYTPAVHRLFQVAANIYDATQTNIYPSVFRPLFTTVGSNVFLTGFTNDARFTTLPEWLANNRRYGIPLVIGAKKGFPNFNEFTLQTDVTVTRKLSFSRPDTNSPPNQTNQMYILGISNLFAAEAWNSYQAPYPRSLEILVTDQATVMITNSGGPSPILNMPLSFVGSLSNLGPNGWQGKQILLPINEQKVILPPSVYHTLDRSFEPVGATNQFDQGFATPEWFLVISNDFQYLLLDGDHILDFVISKQFNAHLDIDQALMGTRLAMGMNGVSESVVVAELWDTNRQTASLFTPTHGILRQISICLGMTMVSDATWLSYLNDTMRGLDKTRVIVGCQQFFRIGGTQYPNVPLSMTGLTLQSPFCPIRRLVQTSTWQVDDPLVHYHPGDLVIHPSGSNWINEFIVPPAAPVPTNMMLSSLGRINARYSPWGGPPDLQYPLNPPGAYDMAVKDPGVRSSDDWDFPCGENPIVGRLGRVHRGTPWQTIYLKSPAASAGNWQTISADPATHPTNDWAIACSLANMWNTNPPQRLVSINEPSPSILAGVFEGVSALTNILSDEALLSGEPLQFELLSMSSNSPQAATLVEAIRRSRSAIDSQRFRSLANLFTIPELTATSPWLNTAPLCQQYLGLTDAAYECIPQAILSRFREEDIECFLTQSNGVAVLVMNVPWLGMTCGLETSTDLQQWTTVPGLHSPSNGVIFVELPLEMDRGCRFYRATARFGTE